MGHNGSGRWRWIESGITPGHPAMNMALDQALFELAARSEFAGAVRVYGWAHASITVGRLQNAAEVRLRYPDRVLVRRPTGGRAVEHDGDLTICVVARESDLTRIAGRGISASHRLLVECVRRALGRQGVRTGYGTERKAGHDPDCFSVAHECDLVDPATGCKLLGSAQARSGGAVIEQMSLRGWAAGTDWFGQEFLAALRESFQVGLGVDGWEPDPRLTEPEAGRAHELLDKLVC